MNRRVYWSFALKQAAQKYRKKKKDLLVMLMDLEKESDRVNKKNLKKSWKNM